jgi:hypothetical protein
VTEFLTSTGRTCPGAGVPDGGCRSPAPIRPAARGGLNADARRSPSGQHKMATHLAPLLPLDGKSAYRDRYEKLNHGWHGLAGGKVGCRWLSADMLSSQKDNQGAAVPRKRSCLLPLSPDCGAGCACQNARPSGSVTGSPSRPPPDQCVIPGRLAVRRGRLREAATRRPTLSG